MKRSGWLGLIAALLIMSVSQAKADSNQFLIHVDAAAHQNFGLYYPATYRFRIPSGSTALVVQYRYSLDSTWNNLPEKTNLDLFNGIDAVRFDYPAGFAYVSIRFNRTSDNILVRVLDQTGSPVNVLFDSIPRFYDGRKAAVTITLDDWQNSSTDAAFGPALGYLASYGLYFSVGVITQSLPWSSVQQKITQYGDLMEIASKSVSAPCDGNEYSLSGGYDAQTAGSRDAIRKNLSVPYVPLYVEPCGYTDAGLVSSISSAGYLTSRGSSDWFPKGSNFAPWLVAQGRYDRAAVVFDDWSSTNDPTLLSQANSGFDQAVAAGGIYHLVDFPYQKKFWFDGSYLLQHLNYIKGKKDLWYVPFGQLYLYHYLQEMRGNLTVQPVTTQATSANFSGSPATGVAPLSVSFSDSSTGTNVAWLWDFGDGGTSNQQNASHIYQIPGSYTVALAVTGTTGSDTLTRTGYITVTPPSQVTLSFSPGAGGTISGATPQTVSYGGSSTPLSAAPATGYHFVNWTGDNGFVATTANPLTVTGAFANQNIRANFAVNQYLVTFTAGPGGTLTGTTSQSLNYGASADPVTAVPSPGFLFVNWTDNNGFTSTSNPLTVTNVAASQTITANFGPDPNAIKGKEFVVHIDSSAHQKFGLTYPATYIFNLPQGATGLTAQYRYSSDGVWNALQEKTSTDFFNGIDAVRFDYSSGFAYVSIRFSRPSDNIFIRIVDTSGSPVETIFSSIPRFYDGRKATVTVTLDDWMDLTHDAAFRAATDYLSSDGLYFSVGVITKFPPWSSIQEKINQHGDFMEIASHSVTHPCSASEYDAAGGYDAETIGSRDALGSNLTFTAKPYVPLFIEPCGYTDTGLVTSITSAGYLVSRGVSDWFPKGVTFTPWLDSEGRYGRAAVVFDDWGSSNDPTLLSQANAAFDQAVAAEGIYHLMDHPYQKALWFDGSYLLQHLDYIKGRRDLWYVPFGQLYMYHYLQEMRGNLSVKVYTAQPPSASFSAAPLTGQSPLPVSFTDSSTGAIVNWLWDFGDSITSSQQNPVHVYTAPGNYTVKLTVTSAAGGDTKTQAGYITATSPPKVTVTFSAGAGGSIVGTTPQIIDYGASTSAVTAVPATGYRFVAWTDDGNAVVSSANPLSLTNVTDNRTITANFALDSPAPDLTVTKSHGGDFKQGQNDAAYTITVTNGGTAPTSGTVKVTETLPVGLKATSFGGSGWNCSLSSLTCTRSGSLAAGSSYPAIILKINVASAAPSSVVNSVTVSGGADLNLANNTAYDPTTITPIFPDLTIDKNHKGDFKKGQHGATYTIKVSNIGNAATAGTVTVTDILPGGLTATAISGPGWTCKTTTLTCTRDDALGIGKAYPIITVKVNVSSNAPSSLTNTATVSGGGEINTSNNTATHQVDVK